MSDYYEIGNVRYYFLKVPYQIIKECTGYNLRDSDNLKASKILMTLDDAVGFHFMRQPIVESKLITDKTHVEIHL